ncbi:hypothetical protein B0H13DRAFT_2282648 [Mycena leptocephala]|nr:hypothetical protein B0H13DRAFT_2282648 [Mycena leptocephala]
MSDNLLPDEIISEILSPALKVSDEVFSDTSDVSPFANYSESTSAYLLVCKSWLRVATPLLYNVVILRSKAQAKALSVALSKNKQLGQFIKKLRVEGGYGPSMLLILQCSPNISDLFISFEIYASDNTAGLCKGLPLLNPTRFILRDVHNKRLENKMVSQLVDTVAELISKWDRLCVFDCPYIRKLDRGTKIIQPLVKSKRLHTLAIPNASGLSWAYSMFKQCPLKHPHKKPGPALMGLLKYTEIESPAFGKAKAQDPILELPPSLNPAFKPMAGAPKAVQDAVWARVLYFAMSIPELADDPSPRKRLGLPHYYTHTVLRDDSAISNFAYFFLKPIARPTCSQLGGTSEAYDAWSTEFSDDESDFDEVLQRGSDARHPFTNRPISWGAFEALAKSCGSSLHKFSVRIGKRQSASATIFNDFTALRTLSWKCQSSFINAPPDGFPNLEELWISQTSQSFLATLSRMRLQSLRRVLLSSGAKYPEEFLKAHGRKLIELDLPYSALANLTVKIFDLCPSLNSISLSMGWPNDDYPDAKDFRASQVVPSLVKIILDLPYWTKNKDQVAAWERFFVDFKSHSFPNLCEIELKCCAWPTSERDIAKSCWVRWAEILLKRNISLTDKTGKKWRPRLKVK